MGLRFFQRAPINRRLVFSTAAERQAIPMRQANKEVSRYLKTRKISYEDIQAIVRAENFPELHSKALTALGKNVSKFKDAPIKTFYGDNPFVFKYLRIYERVVSLTRIRKPGYTNWEPHLRKFARLLVRRILIRDFLEHQGLIVSEEELRLLTKTTEASTIEGIAA